MMKQDGVTVQTKKKEGSPNILEVASTHIQAPPRDPRAKSRCCVFSRLLFLWMEPLFCAGFCHELEHNDLYAHPSEADSEKLLKRFNRHWNTEIERRKNGRQPRLIVAILKCTWWRILLHGIMMLAEMLLVVSQSVVLGYLTDYFSIQDPSAEDTRNAYLYALGLCVLTVLFMMVFCHAFLIGYKIGMISRITLTAATYQKILSLSQGTVSSISTGHIVNLASNDVQQLELAFVNAPSVLIPPIHLVIATYLIYLELGWTAFLTIAFVVVYVILQVILGRLHTHWRFKAARLTDKRVRIMNEIISGIRVIKMYAWENTFKKLVANLRRKESLFLLQGGMIQGFNLGFFFISQLFMTFILLTVYTSNGGDLSPKKVFTTVSLLFGLRVTAVIRFAVNVIYMSEAKVAISRLQKLLEMEELVHSTPLSNKKCSNSSAHVPVKNLSASWNCDKENRVLNGVAFEVDQQYPLLAVVGQVGAGKSSLLQCLLGELKLLDGSIEVKGRISYASQEAWIFSATLPENILFGKPYNQERYNTVLEACALDKDCKQLVDGDLTLVGERGVTLSGGQKARVNLARAVYHDADIFLLDDPLSAVDSAVARHIFDKCICGLLKGHLIVLVTHQVHFALKADKILALRKGHVQLYGAPSELLAQGIDLKQQLLNLDKEGAQEDQLLCNTDDDEISDDMKLTTHYPQVTPYSNDSPAVMLPCDQKSNGGATLSNLESSPSETRKRRLHKEEDHLQVPSMLSLYSRVEDVSDCDQDPDTAAETMPTLPPEDKGHGNISLATYYRYFMAGGNILVLALMLVLFILAEGGIVVFDWWLSDWAICSQLNTTLQAKENNSIPSTCYLSTNQRIAIYAGCFTAAVVLSVVRSLLFYYICVNASRVLHNRMFASVLRAPVRFFDTNPIGRVLNRFSKDVGFLDKLLPYIFCEYVLYVFQCSAIIITAVISNIWLLLPVVFLIAALVCLQQYYLRTSRDIKRLEAIARSPVYLHISMTLQGLSTIRALKQEELSLQIFHQNQNKHTQGWFLSLVARWWLSLRVYIFVGIFISTVAFISIPLSSELTPSLVGLVLTYCIALANSSQYTIKQSTEVENTTIEPEAELETLPPNEKPPPSWPDKGMITMEDVAFQYSSELPLVLKDLCFTIQPAEKVGVVGRTGAGKSSLISVLYRLAEPHGLITIDGVDTKAIGLHDLRKKMSIIPQDPVLFSGTMRYNLDPFDEYTDAELWEALEQVQLKSAVQQLEGQLEGKVSEGGSNFSVGQRQLVCLARALLRKNKILVLDEATANVDMKTDDIIQQVLRKSFSECTVVTIAHRLNTIMDSDKILVMDEGQVKEFDSPYNLLQDPRSLFYKMVQKTGPSASKKLQWNAQN